MFVNCRYRHKKFINMEEFFDPNVMPLSSTKMAEHVKKLVDKGRSLLINEYASKLNT